MKTAIELAREAGSIHIHKKPKEFAIVGNEAITLFAELVRADERKACAKICEDLCGVNGYDRNLALVSASAAIRSRGNDAA